MQAKVNIPSTLCELIDRFVLNGHSAYFVGGCVRDSILGNPVYDYDVTTSARPEVVTELFYDCKVIPTGIKHGTVTVVYKGYPVEITTFRKDGFYKDNRHPASVEFSQDLQEDTKRRDFTINALCYNHLEGLIDHHGGLEDLQSCIVKCVGDPSLRFKEDALRILRGLRFAARFGFDIDPSTATSMLQNRHLIQNVSSERILSELKGFFESEHSYRYVKEYFPILSSACCVDGYIDVCTLESILKAIVPQHRMAAFFAVCGGSTEGAVKLIRRLKPDNKTLFGISSSAEAYYNDCFADAVSVGRTIRKYGLHSAEVLYAINTAAGRNICLDAQDRIKYMEDGLLPLSIKELAVNGNDIASLGITVGEDIGAVLEHLFNKVHLGVQNTKNTLLSEAKRFMDERGN